MGKNDALDDAFTPSFTPRINQMAAQYLMSWEGGKKHRWVKMHNGVRYRVSCIDLNAPPTKVDSYLAANQWWRQKLNSLGPKQKKQLAPRPDQEDAIREIDRRIDFAQRSRPDLLKNLKNDRAKILAQDDRELQLLDADQISAKIQLLKMAGWRPPHNLDPVALQIILGSDQTWAERYRQADSNLNALPISDLIAKYLELLRQNIKPASHYEIQNYFNRLMNDSRVLNNSSVPNAISERTVDLHFEWLVSKNYEIGTHNKYLGFFRAFIKWLYQQKLIETIPRNLLIKIHRKKVRRKKIRVFDKLLNCLHILNDTYKLWALLGLNCGMTAVDLGSTCWEDIEQEKWILTRLRTKTEDCADTPTVRYRLWPETVTLLKRLPKRDGMLFLTDKGEPMYRSWYSDGRMKKKDLFGSYWQRLDPKPSIPLGKFRSVAATGLKNSPIWRAYIDYFLGHAAGKTSDKFYGEEADTPFFTALDFLRAQLGIESLFS